MAAAFPCSRLHFPCKTGLVCSSISEQLKALSQKAGFQDSFVPATRRSQLHCNLGNLHKGWLSQNVGPTNRIRDMCSQSDGGQASDVAAWNARNILGERQSTEDMVTDGSLHEHGERLKDTNAVGEAPVKNQIVQSPPANATTSADAGCQKEVWVWTQNKGVFTAATEAGLTHLVFEESDEGRQLANAWKGLANFCPLFCDGNFFQKEDPSVEARLTKIASPQDLDDVIERAEQMAQSSRLTTVVEFVEWKVIPAENLVAAFDGKPGRLFAVADGAQDAIVSFEALERGTDGVVLRTEDPADIFAIKEYVDKRAGGAAVPLVYGHVTRVEPVGMGDRACVDLCSLLKPGEGMLVGSFARALFLVHSECLESNYVASRPFRVNAGPVHSYVAAPGGKTAYLSELQSGREVQVVDSRGRTRNALVGRVKIESRPLILVEAEADGQRHSILLQNAETVRLIGQAESGNEGEDERVPVSVSKLKVGDKVLLSVQESAARHTGIKVKESIDER